MNNKKTNKVEKKYGVVFILCALIVFVIWCLTFRLCFWDTFLGLIIKDSEYISRGEIGDMFGAVNALFSGLAFAGLIVTLVQQKEELSLQRVELSHTRAELKNQNKTMKRQRFENTFFNLMTMLEHITDNLECNLEHEASGVEKKYKGREVFDVLYQGEIGFADGIKKYLKSRKVEDLFKYDNFKILNHYFKVLKGVLKYIDESDLLEDKERQLYVVILRNTFSDSERCIIVYYFAVQGGWHKDIAEKYGLFYGIDKDELAEKEHYDLFDSCAYEYNGRM